jgi:hypothetical protein
MIVYLDPVHIIILLFGRVLSDSGAHVGFDEYVRLAAHRTILHTTFSAGTGFLRGFHFQGIRNGEQREQGTCYRHALPVRPFYFPRIR